MKTPLLLIFSVILCSFAHKYYVSNTQVFFNEQSQSFEVTMKIFTDDLELVLRAEHSDSLRLDLGKAPMSTNHAMEDYLRKNFFVTIDNQPVTWSYLGMEVEYDMCYMYLEFPWLEPLQELRVKNTCLFDYFDKQSNVVNIEYKGMRKKLVLLDNLDTDSMLN